MNWRDIRILHEDNHLLAVVKPAGLLTQADRTGEEDLLSLMKAYLVETRGKPGNAFLGLVHRLDRPVGGVLVFAKTSKCASRLSEQIRARTVRKRYAAVVAGAPPPGEHRWVDYLAKDPQQNRVEVVSPEYAGAKRAELVLRAGPSRGPHTRVDIELITGRAHQIRVQCATRGVPLVGDRKYGGPPAPNREIALWSHAIDLTHPTLRTPVHLVAPPPNVAPWTP